MPKMMVEPTGRAAVATASQRLRLREAAIPAMAGASVLLASFVNFLGHNQYPLLTPEVGLVAVLLLTIAFLAGLAYAGAEKFVRAMLQVLLVCLALDLNFDGPAVWIAAAIVILAVNRHLMPFIGVASLVVLVSGLGIALPATAVDDVAPPIADTKPVRPALLHLVLDEHVGVEGLLGSAAETAAVRDRLKGFYRGNGFRLFGGAYSEHFHSVNAIPQILNLGEEQPWSQPDPRGMSLARVAYFDRLRDAGYELRVYQTDFLKFCDPHSNSHCRQYRQQDAGSIARTALPPQEKALLLVYNFAFFSGIATSFTNSYDAIAGETLPKIGLNSRRRIDPLGAMSMIDDLTEDLRLAEPGQAFLAHLLIPHDPYILGRDCSIKNTSDWSVRQSGEAAGTRTRNAYFDQLECLELRLARMFDALMTSKAGRNVVIVVHGDHGYRDSWPEPLAGNLGRFSDEDLVQSYSTLFAIHAPGIQPGYDARRLPVARLLSAAVDSGFSSIDVALPADFEPSVVLGDHRWRPVKRHSLPNWWIAP